MAPELEEFRQRVIAHAKQVTLRAPKVESEASTNASLVQPFLVTLGYDVTNPDEVSPEHHADFSDKYQNKVDYAILHKNAPVIALESKRVGSVLKDDRGQLRSYFNACPTVKLGILTDGLKYEFYADSDKPNMMDDAAFLRLDFAAIAKDNSIDDNTLSGIAAIRNGLFNPEDVGAEAKRKLLFESVISAIKKFKSEPSDDFIRFILSQSEIGGKITRVNQRVIEQNRDLVRSAMEGFVAQEALARFGYAPKDLVKTLPELSESPTTPQITPQEAETDLHSPTEAEFKALEYVKNRLFFLVRNDVLFHEVQKLMFKKTKSSFRIYYGRPNSGSLMDYKEQRDGKVSVTFPALEGRETGIKPCAELDECLLHAFTKRVVDSGLKIDTIPVLRSITGGHANSGGV